MTAGASACSGCHFSTLHRHHHQHHHHHHAVFYNTSSDTSLYYRTRLVTSTAKHSSRPHRTTRRQLTHHRHGSHWILPIKFSGFLWPRSKLFRDPLHMQQLLSCNFSRLLLTYTDSIPSPFSSVGSSSPTLTQFHHHLVQSHNSDDTHHFPQTTSKISRLSLTFHVSGNPGRVLPSWKYHRARVVVHSSSEAFATTRYINWCFTYLLTYKQCHVSYQKLLFQCIEPYSKCCKSLKSKCV